MKYFFLNFLVVFSAFFAIAQDEVKSVQLYAKGDETALPIIALNGGRLNLEFDVLSDEAPYLYYEIQHYSADWTKKDLNPLDYAKGFHSGSIDDFEFSFNTNQLYTHYEFEFPNSQLQLKVSGNYKIVVYADSVDEPLFAKEFYVTEQTADIQVNIRNAVNRSKLQSHHQIDFVVNAEGLSANNARQEFSANVMQNYRKDNMLIDVQPNRLDRNVLVFSNPFDFNFEAGNEFRWFNTKSVRYKTQGVAEIISKNNRTDVWLIPDLERKKSEFVVWNDFNGQYTIEHQEGNRPDIDGDYVYVHFTLKETPEIKSKEVYVFGGLTDWQIKPEYQLTMNPRQNLLETVLYLKQGNYDYQYIVKDGENYSVAPVEGSFYRTENLYMVFVYYTPFGARYDRLVGVQTFTSRFN